MAKQVSINEFRHYLTFEKKAIGGVDEYGQRGSAWSDHRSLWAKLEVKQGNEEVSADRKAQVTRFVFTIRSVPDLNASMRIRYREARYSIQAIYDKEGIGKHLTIEARLDNANRSEGVV